MLFVLLGGMYLAAAFVPSEVFVRSKNKSSRLLMSLPNWVDTLTSGLASIARLPYGVTVSDTAASLELSAGDTLPITSPCLAKLYDVENSKHCREVRERITELDLVVERVIPSAKNSRVFEDPKSNFRLPPGTSVPRLVIQSGGEEKALSESEIVPYLDETFSKEQPRRFGSLENGGIAQVNDFFQLKDLGAYAAMFLRFGRGIAV